MINTRRDNVGMKCFPFSKKKRVKCFSIYRREAAQNKNRFQRQHEQKKYIASPLERARIHKHIPVSDYCFRNPPIIASREPIDRTKDKIKKKEENKTQYNNSAYCSRC